MADPRRHRIDSWLPGMPSLPAVGLNGGQPPATPHGEHRQAALLVRFQSASGLIGFNKVFHSFAR